MTCHLKPGFCSRSRSALLMLTASLSGCSMTETTTSVRTELGRPYERVRLERADAPPLLATWRQEGLTLVGQLAFSDACRTEAVQVTRRTQVTDTHPNRRFTAGAYVTGAALSLLGIALFANAQGKDETVTCGGGGTPKSGDKCYSEAGAWREIGAITIGAGLGAILGGVMVQSRKPVVQTKDLPSNEQVRVVSSKGSCGNTAAFEGATAAASLSTGGKWIGVIDGEGTVRIDLRGSSPSRGTLATMSVESAAPDAAPSLVVGTALGQLELQPAHSAATSAAKSKSSGVFIR